MALFNRKSIDEERLENITYIRKMASTSDLLVKYAEGTEHINKMTLLADDVKYLIPIQSVAISVIDKKIHNILGDLKILLYTNRDTYRVQNKLEDLEKLINERSSKI